MTKIQLCREILREEMDKNIEIAKRKFIKSILPIYGSSIKGNPIHIGTCLLIKIGEAKILLTAAHIIDELKTTELYIGACPDLFPIVGQFKVTPKVEGTREKDHFDFAYLALEGEMAITLCHFPFIDESNISNYKGDTYGRHYVAFGYPTSKNKKINLKSNTVQPKFMKYSSIVKKNELLCNELRISGDDHLFLDYNSKHSMNSDGDKINSISPIGISGGALIDMGNNKQILEGKTANACELVAMLIENHKKYNLMSSVKLDFIINVIKKTKLPSNTRCYGRDGQVA